MNGVSQLKCKHRICLHLPEPGPKLSGCEPVLVQPITPGDSTQHLYITSHQPVATLLYHTDVRVSWVGSAELTGTALLFTMYVELGISQNSFNFAIVTQSEAGATFQFLFLLCCHR